MSYDYQNQKPALFTDAGQRMFLAIRDRVHEILNRSGAISMGSAISEATGDSWKMVACVDRMVELGELREIQQTPTPSGQCRIFVLAQ